MTVLFVQGSCCRFYVLVLFYNRNTTSENNPVCEKMTITNNHRCLRFLFFSSLSQKNCKLKKKSYPLNVYCGNMYTHVTIYIYLTRGVLLLCL